MSKRQIKPLIKYDSDEDYLDERVALEESIKNGEHHQPLDQQL